MLIRPGNRIITENNSHHSINVDTHTLSNHSSLLTQFTINSAAVLLNSTRSTQASLLIFLITIWNFMLSICVSLYQMASSRKFQKRENICSIYKHETKKEPKIHTKHHGDKVKNKGTFLRFAISASHVYKRAALTWRSREWSPSGGARQWGKDWGGGWEKGEGETGRHALGNGKAFKWDSNQGNMSGCFQLGSLTFSQLSAGAKAAFSLIV